MKEVELTLNHKFGEFELSYWPPLFDTPECKATAHDGRYWLSACRLAQLTGDELLESAKKLKTMMRAIVKIELGIDFELIDPDDPENDLMSYRERLDDSLSTHIRLGKPPSAVFGVPPVTATIIDEFHNGTPEPRKERWYDYYVCQCDDWIDNTVTFQALSLFALKVEPITLRKVYEKLEDCEKDKNGKHGRDNLRKATKIPSRQLNNLTRSLSHPDMEGQAAHIKSSTSKDTFVPMSLAAATKCVGRRLLKPWLIKQQIIFRLAAGDAQAKHLTNLFGT